MDRLTGVARWVLIGAVALGVLSLVLANTHLQILEKDGVAYQIADVCSGVTYILTVLLAIFLSSRWERSVGWIFGALFLPFITPLILACLGESPDACGSGHVGISTCSDSRFWVCPGCGCLLEKRATDAAQFYSPGAMVVGTVTCGECGTGYPHRDVYSGRYDLGPAGISEAMNAAQIRATGGGGISSTVPSRQGTVASAPMPRGPRSMSVVVTDIGENGGAAVSAIATIMAIDEDAAREVLDRAPGTILTGVSKRKSNKITGALGAAGATVIVTDDSVATHVS